ASVGGRRERFPPRSSGEIQSAEGGRVHGGTAARGLGQNLQAQAARSVLGGGRAENLAMEDPMRSPFIGCVVLALTMASVASADTMAPAPNARIVRVDPY